MKTGFKIAAALVAITLAAAVGAYLWMSASAPTLPDTFRVAVAGGSEIDVTSSAFAADFSAALSAAELKPFGRGDTTATLKAGSDTYSLAKTDEGLLVKVGPRNYLIDETTATQLAEHSGLERLYTDFYPRPLIVEINDKLWHVPPMSGEWEYMGIDGLFHTYVFGDMCPQIITLSEPAGIAYRFESASAAPYVLYGDGFDQQEGDTAEGTFAIDENQILTFSATPAYDTDNFRGQLDFALTFQVEKDEEPDTEPAPSESAPPEAEPAGTDPESKPAEPEPEPAAPSPESEPTPTPEPEAQPTVKGSDDLSFSVSQTSTMPGEMLTLKVTGATASEVSCQTDLRASAKFFDDADGAIALIPVRLSVEPGSYSLSLSAHGQTESWTITVENKDFVVQHLTVDQATAEETILSQQANNEYNQKIEPLKTIYDSEVYWSGSFIMPVQGRITTEFGTKRYTNGSTTPSWHAAIDIGAARGTEVKATHNGRVLFSEYIALTGNTILIEHGIGLKSWYYHMDSLSVAAGDMVTQGQTIGTVGSTGFSTGPHLHFGMSVGEYYVNPWSFID